MLYVNFVYKGTVVENVAFYIDNNDITQKGIAKEIKDGKYTPENWERYLFSDYNMINEWVG